MMKNMINNFIKDKWSISKFILLLLILLIYGCASALISSKQGFKQVKSSEGIVIGSILVINNTTTDTPPTSSNFFNKLARYGLGGKRHKYRFDIWKNKSFLSCASIKTEFEGEKIFIIKLEGGEYKFSEMHVESLPGFFITTDIQFTVLPGEITYIGKLILLQDQYLKSPFHNPYRYHIEDTFDKTISALKEEEYANHIKNVNRKLMVIRK